MTNIDILLYYYPDLLDTITLARTQLVVAGKRDQGFVRYDAS